jgi:hypothetical protein
VKKYSGLWLIASLLVMMTAGCDNNDGVISPRVTRPTVNSTDPENAATYVILTQPIEVHFSKKMDNATFTTATFTLMRGTTLVSGTVSCSDTSAVFTPDSVLGHYTVYTATITTGAKDISGHALASDHVWSFTTGGPLLGSVCNACHDAFKH